MFAMLKNPNFKMDASFTTIIDELKPLENEIVVKKIRVGAFSTTPLDTILKAQNISHIILTGYATTGVILSTVRDAADRDYAITVISDCTADFSSETQEIMMKKVFPMQATVLTTEEFIKK